MLISKQQGTLIPRYAPGDSLIDYTSGTGYNGIWKIKHDDSVEVGSLVDFSDGDKQKDRTYGIQATIATSKYNRVHVGITEQKEALKLLF